ncbi:hypothetical protein PInf_008580 [Phytophthora infestans]|nr:hypothetical protein PInf_008580 [Phytophthora infestans]
MHEEVSDREVITALLTGLGDTYESMVEIFDNLDDISLQQVKIKLTSREERLNQAKAVKETKARKKASFQAGNGGAQLGGSLSEEKNVSLVNKRKWSRGGGRGQTKRPRSEIYCHNCGKLGHYASGKEEDVDFVDTELTKRFKLKCLEARQFDKLKIEVYTDATFASEGGDFNYDDMQIKTIDDMKLMSRRE